MNNKFKRSIIGYKKKEVQQAIEVENAEFEKLYREYKEELFKLINENQRLKGQAENLNNETFSYIFSKEKMQNLLYDTHMEALTSLFAAEQKLSTMIKEKTRLLENHQNKGETIKLSINNLLKDIEAIVEDEVG